MSGGHTYVDKTSLGDGVDRTVLAPSGDGGIEIVANRIYPAAAIDPVAPPPNPGDRYFNTVAGEWRWYNGASWRVYGGAAAAVTWPVGVSWASVDAALDLVGRSAIVLVEGDEAGPRLMTRSLTSIDGTTDLSRVWFVGVWPPGIVTEGPPKTPWPNSVVVDWDAAAGSEFQLGGTGLLQSENVLWQYGAIIGSATGPMKRIKWVLDGGGIQPQPGHTGYVVTIGKVGLSALFLRNEAIVGHIGLATGMFSVWQFVAGDEVLSIHATTGSVLGPKTVRVNGAFPLEVGVTYDSSVSISPTWIGGGPTILAVNPLDQASSVVYTDNTAGGWALPVPIEVNDAIDRLNIAWNSMNTNLGLAGVPGFPIPLP